MKWIQLTTIFSAASQILSTLASDKPLIPVECCEKIEDDNNLKKKKQIPAIKLETPIILNWNLNLPS